MTQHVKEPTRNNNILDLVLTTNPDMVENVEVIEPFGNSDHCIVTFDLKLKTNTKEWKENYFDYRNGDYEGMRNFLTNTDWSEIQSNDTSVEYAWTSFRKTIEDAVTQFVPQKTRKPKSRKPLYWNREIHIARKNRVKWWWKTYKRTELQEDYNKYKASLKRANKVIRKAKRRLEKKIANNVQKDPKLFYKYMRSKLTVKDVIGPLVSDGNIVDDEAEMAGLLNTFFASTFTSNEDTNNIPTTKKVFKGRLEEELKIILLDPEVIVRKL